MKKTTILLFVIPIIPIGGGIFYMTQNTTKPASQPNNQNSSTSQSYTSRDISFESEGHTIYGRILLPEQDGPLPTVLFSHGFGGNHKQEETLQKTLAENGISVYSFDFAGGTGYSPGRSEGEMTEMSVLTEVQNLTDALAMIQN